MAKPMLGEFGRCELAIGGTGCGRIKQLANEITTRLSANNKIAYVDASHGNENPDYIEESTLQAGANLVYTDEQSQHSLVCKGQLNRFERHALFNQHDLVLVNGNHFTAAAQVLVIDPAKPVEKKIEKYNNVQLIILTEGASIPAYISNHINVKSLPVCSINDTNQIAEVVQSFIGNHRPTLKTLILSGGESTRMKRDKGNLVYHYNTQRRHLQQMLSGFGATYVSCNQQQAEKLKDEFSIIEDSFLGLGPLGGILSAFKTDPTAAWLTVACDLPLLSAKTLQYLIDNRQPSKLATAFYNRDNQFPEPLVTIWEPKSYAVILQFFSQGYSCPRKVLINADVALLQAPDSDEFTNVNSTEEYELVMNKLKTQGEPI